MPTAPAAAARTRGRDSRAFDGVARRPGSRARCRRASERVPPCAGPPPSWRSLPGTASATARELGAGDRCGFTSRHGDAQRCTQRHARRCTDANPSRICRGTALRKSASITRESLPPIRAGHRQGEESAKPWCVSERAPAPDGHPSCRCTSASSQSLNTWVSPGCQDSQHSSPARNPPSPTACSASLTRISVPSPVSVT